MFTKLVVFITKFVIVATKSSQHVQFIVKPVQMGNPQFFYISTYPSLWSFHKFFEID
jgi:hypothetical protein